MSMSRKQYEQIAAELAKSRPSSKSRTARETWEDVVVRLVVLFKNENPAFNKRKFYDACGWGVVFANEPNIEPRVARGRAEHEQCEVGTVGCSVEHASVTRDVACQTW